MDENKLFTVCFELAENLMWEKDATPLEKQDEQIAELSQMTEKFIELAKQNFTLIEDYPDSSAVLLGAISYLNTIAIPPLRGNYNWFDYSLQSLLDIAYPQGSPGKAGLPYLIKAREGIEQSIEWANEPDEDGQ